MSAGTAEGPGGAAPQRLRVVTFNIRGGLGMDGKRSIERIAAAIRELAPDLVGLQEVHCRLPWSGMVDQPRRLGLRTGLRPVFRSSFTLGFGGYGNACLTRLVLVRSGRRRMRSGREPRSVLWMEGRLGQQRVRALVTHFGLDAEEIRWQADHLSAMVREDDLPTIVAADLNVGPDSTEVDRLLATGLRHAVSPDLPSYPADTPRHRIDYLLVSRHWSVESGAVFETLVSDHRPLVANLSLLE